MIQPHRITSVKKDGRVTIVHCECGGSFDSIESEVLARLYHQRHIIIEAKKKKAQA